MMHLLTSRNRISAILIKNNKIFVKRIMLTENTLKSEPDNLIASWKQKIKMKSSGKFCFTKEGKM